MSGRVLITGGAGFIGGHLAHELLDAGYAVRILDTLIAQVHGAGRNRPEHLSDEAELVVGDILDCKTVGHALRGIDAVIHLAALVGVGQSMYEMAAYTRVNGVGTAVLLEALATNPVQKLVVASSMSVYGEGLYRMPDGRPCLPASRPEAQLRRREWDLRGPAGETLVPSPTAETIPTHPQSVYSLSKLHQEQLCLLAGRALGLPVVALRLFNVYGPGQSLANPYTGVLSIFASRLLNGKPPILYEDGGQLRDFVNVTDAVRACRAALERDSCNGYTVNVASGRTLTILDAADIMARLLRIDIQPTFVGRARVGDVRHCFADIERAREVLDFEAQIPIERGISEYARWLAGRSTTDTVEAAFSELTGRGLAI